MRCTNRGRKARPRGGGKSRFTGTCYRAANWQYLGDTKGRGKLDTRHLNAQPIKSIWVYPIARDFRTQLCNGYVSHAQIYCLDPSHLEKICVIDRTNYTTVVQRNRVIGRGYRVATVDLDHIAGRGVRQSRARAQVDNRVGPRYLVTGRAATDVQRVTGLQGGGIRPARILATPPQLFGCRQLGPASAGPVLLEAMRYRMGEREQLLIFTRITRPSVVTYVL